MDILLDIKNVRKEFTNHLALDNVSMSIPRQSVFGLLGPNGAGKTTLIRIINQISKPDSGTILLNNEPLQEKHISKIGYLPEERGLYKKMKVGEQAMYLCRLKGLSKPDAEKQLKNWFLKFEIQEWWDKKVEELSKGMQQKVQFIITVLHKPELLIFDEPFSGFDPINANLIKEEILKLKEQGATIIFSTHNMGSVEEICDNIALINKSKKILEGSVIDIKQKFKDNAFKLEYFDKPQNIPTEIIDRYQLTTIAQPYSIQIKLPENENPNEMIQNLMPYGQIKHIQEILPSINDIFIQQVNKANTQI